MIIENLREEVRNIKAGGVNVEAVEDARVVLKSGGGGGGDAGVKGAKGRIGGNGPKGGGGGGGGGKEIVQVKDLCQVVPRGRLLVLMVGEKEV